MRVRLSMPCIADKEELLNNFRKILDSGYFVQGEQVRIFEEKLKEYLGTKYCIAVSSGTAALHLALLALNIHEGDEVIVPSFTFPATVNVIELVKAKPVFVDVDLDTYNINVKQIESKITSKTKAIMPVHLFGNPAEMDVILEIAKKVRTESYRRRCRCIRKSLQRQKVWYYRGYWLFQFPSKKSNYNSRRWVSCHE